MRKEPDHSMIPDDWPGKDVEPNGTVIKLTYDDIPAGMERPGGNSEPEADQ